MNITITQDQELELSSRIKWWEQERKNYLLADDTTQVLMIEDTLCGVEWALSVLGLTELSMLAWEARNATITTETEVTK